MIKKITLLLFLSLLLFSCNKRHFFESYVQIPNNVWNENNIVKFSVPVSDDSLSYNISINIRHGYSYRYKNLWLFIKTISPSGVYELDTLNCVLTKMDNSWKGNCLGNICDYPVVFVDDIKFKAKGTYIFEIRQGMRQKNVLQIAQIGLIIDKVNTNKK